MGGAAAVVYGGANPTEFAGPEYWKALETRVAKRVLELLPEQLPLVHGYIDETLALQTTLKANLAKMSPAEFERVLVGPPLTP